MANPIKYDSQTRMTRGIELLEHGVKITEQQDGSFAVPSLTRNSIYEVILLKSIWVHIRYFETSKAKLTDISTNDHSDAAKHQERS